MGNLGASMIASPGFKSLLSTAYVLTLFAAATVAAAVVALKSRRLRKMGNGEPVTLIRNGVLLRENLRKTKVNIDVLLMLLREKGYFSYEDIQFAVLEPSGNLSILPTQESQSVSKRDLAYGPDMSPDGGGPYTELVVDGEVDEDKLESTGHDRDWLLHQLHRFGAQSLAQITYMAINSQGDIIVDAHRLRKPSR